MINSNGLLCKILISTLKGNDICYNYILVLGFLLIHYCNALPHRMNVAEGWYDQWALDLLKFLTKIIELILTG